MWTLPTCSCNFYVNRWSRNGAFWIQKVERNTIRLTPYRKPKSGQCAGELHDLKTNLATIAKVKKLCIKLPADSVWNAVTCLISGIYLIVLAAIWLNGNVSGQLMRETTADIETRNAGITSAFERWSRHDYEDDYGVSENAPQDIYSYSNIWMMRPPDRCRQQYRRPFPVWNEVSLLQTCLLKNKRSLWSPFF